MKALSLLFFILSLLFFFSAPTALSTCSPSFCSPYDPEIRFPFYLETEPNTRCGYPGFQLSCNNRSRTVLTLPNSGQFLVTQIDYAKQWVFIDDPDNCLPSRMLKNITLSGSPFRPVNSTRITFFNCTSDLSDDNSFRTVPIHCLSSENNYTVVATEDSFVPFGCEKISTVSASLQLLVYQYETWTGVREVLLLSWREPSCGGCEEEGGTCGFKDGTIDEIGCFDVPRKGLSKGARYGVALGIGVPGLVCLIGLVCYTCSRLRNQAQGRHIHHELSSTAITPQPAHFIITGLDRPTINSYPKTVLGESQRLPNPNDGTCSICLAEYKTKDTLRTIPECNHYFHATCIDEWLQMNATCPLCRNSPGVDSSASSLSLSSSSLSSSR